MNQPLDLKNPEDGLLAGAMISIMGGNCHELPSSSMKPNDCCGKFIVRRWILRYRQQPVMSLFHQLLLCSPVTGLGNVYSNQVFVIREHINIFYCTSLQINAEEEVRIRATIALRKKLSKKLRGTSIERRDLLANVKVTRTGQMQIFISCI